MKKEGTVIKCSFYPSKYGRRDWWLVLLVKGKMNLFKVVGSSNFIPSEGDYVVAWGELKDDGEFKATRLVLKEPQEDHYIIDRLRKFDVFNEDEIRKLVRQHGKNIWDLIERGEIETSDPDKLKVQFDTWKHRSDKLYAEFELASYFEEINLPLEELKIRLIIRTLGNNAKERILNDPLCLYQLLDRNFLNHYAEKINLSPDIKKELKFLSTFHEVTQLGKDLCLPHTEFKKKHVVIINSLIEKNYLEVYQNFYYLIPPVDSYLIRGDEDDDDEYQLSSAHGYLSIEKKTASIISELLHDENVIEYSDYLDIAEKNNLSDEQIEVLKMFMKNRFSLVFGGPGNGKTRTIKAIVDLAYAVGATFNLVAPTGRAAKRIRELMNEESYTIHRFILDPNLTKAQYLIVDECSMLDSKLLYDLLSVSDFERIILIGDTNQLPPIGAGFPFLQLRICESIPRVVLTKNFRFDANSEGIAIALKRINNGNADLSNCGNGIEIIDTRNVRKNLNGILEDFPEFNIDHFRVITPLRRVVKGYMDQIRSHYLSADEEVAVGDWVICKKNCSAKNIFNGDIGQIKEINTVTVQKEVKRNGKITFIDHEEIHFSIDFDGNIVILESSSFFNLAYISTVHSSQGGETDNVILIMETDSRINTRQLLYTSLSRAKKCARIIAPKNVISATISRVEETRYSCLELLISEKMDKMRTALE